MPKATNKLIKFTDEQLYAELARRNVDKESLEYKCLSINGFTAKDVVCMKGGEYDAEDDYYGPQYHFYLKVDGKLFNAYYMNCATGPHRNKSPERWPDDKESEHGHNAALSFVPPGFAEVSENSYEYHGKTDVKKHLAKYGVTDYRVWDEKLNDEKAGHDHNYDVRFSYMK